MPQDKEFDTLSFIMEYEGEDLSSEKIINGFQHLIDSGMVWSLQGSYGRMAMGLIENGYCRKAKDNGET